MAVMFGKSGVGVRLGSKVSVGVAVNSLVELGGTGVSLGGMLVSAPGGTGVSALAVSWACKVIAAAV